jgi:hypothetical protein
MSTNTTLLLALGLLVVLAIIIFLVREFIHRSKTVQCDDGPRRTIDLRDFTTKYSGYTVALEASVKDKATASAKFTPIQLQQMSESLQSANEFRKYVVAGYNACAISKAQYGQYEARFQTLDALSRQINVFLSKPSLHESERQELDSLVKQYVDVSSKLVV